MVGLWGALVLAGAAFGVEAPSAWCFPSGLKVAVVPREGAPVIGLASVVSGGSGAELATEIGGAHTVEHLWFRSPRMGYASVDALLEDIGAESNASTTHDDTVFVTIAHRRNARVLIGLEAARILDPLAGIEESVIAVEQNIVRNEILERFEGVDPHDLALMRRLVPPDHPYARGIAGTADQVAALDRAALQAYADRQYAPRSTSLFVIGDIGAKVVLRLVTEGIPSDLLRGAPAPCAPVEPIPVSPPPLPAATGYPEIEVAVDAPTLALGWTLTSALGDAAFAESAAAMIAWQVRKTTHRPVQCVATPYQQLGEVSCYLPLDEGEDPAALASQVLGASRRMWRNAMAEHDSRADYWAAVAREIAHVDAWGDAIDRDVISAGHDGWLHRHAVEFHRTGGQAASGATRVVETARFALEWLSEERVRGAVLVPAQTVAGGTFHGTRGHADARPEVDPATVDADRLEATVVQPDLSALTVTRTDDGLPLWILEMPGVTRAHLSLVYPATERWGDEVTRRGADLLVLGPEEALTGSERTTAWRNQVDLYRGTGETWWSFEARGANARLTMALLMASAPPPIPLLNRKGELAVAEGVGAWRAEAADTPDWAAEVARWDALAGGVPHPLDDPESLAAVVHPDREAVRAFSQDLLQIGRATLVAVVQPGTAAAVQAAAAPKRAGTATATAVAAPTPLREAAPRAVMAFSDPRVAQTGLTVECHVDPGDGAAVWMLSELLDEGLNDALRNELGATYGVHVGIDEAGHGATLHVETRVPHGAAGTATRAILERLDAVAANRVPPGDLARIKLQAARRTATEWQTAEQVLALLREAAVAGRDPRALGIGTRMAAVDGASLAARVAPCTGREIATLVGDVDAIGSALDREGIAWSAP